MAYHFYFPTRIIVSSDASEDLCAVVTTTSKPVLLVLTDKGILQAGVATPVLDLLHRKEIPFDVFSEIPENPNAPDVARALAAAEAMDATHIVAFGGGSVIDTAKAVGILASHPGMGWEDLQWGRTSIQKPALPVIAIPTTAGTGSEVTHVTVIGDSAGFKKGVVHQEVFPKVAILDGSLTLSLPKHLTAATGMDALVHALEAYLGKRANPFTDMYALTAMKMLVEWLPAAVAEGQNLPARQQMTLAATYAGIAMDQSGLGLAHALCGPLAGKYHLHHGLGVAVLLPATLKFNAPAIAPDRWAAMKNALSLPQELLPEDLSGWAQDFIGSLGLPVFLSEMGIQAADIPKIAEDAGRMAMYANNVRQASLADCVALLEGAL
jgi:alcohol dehydrogenase class IV